MVLMVLKEKINKVLKNKKTLVKPKENMVKQEIKVDMPLVTQTTTTFQPQQTTTTKSTTLICPKCNNINFVNVKFSEYHCKDCGYNSSGKEW